MLKPKGLNFYLILIFSLSIINYSWANTSKDVEIAVAKSVYLIDSENYEEAIELLKNALTLRPDDRRLMLYLGIAYSRSGNFSEASDYLQNLLKIEPANCRARYELGIVLLELKAMQESERYFRAVSETCAEETLKEAADSYIEYILKLKESQERKTYLNVITGLQYDSNVILEEASYPSVQKPQKADWRGVSILDSGIEILRGEGSKIKAEYIFYQSIHKSLNDFNIQQHNLNLKLDKEISPKIQFFLHYGTQYSLVGGELYSVINSISPGIHISTLHNLITSISYRHEFRKFFDNKTFPVNSLRTGDIDALEISENISLQKVGSIDVIYTFEKDETDSDLDSITHRVSTQLKADIKRWQFYLKAEYYYITYPKSEPGFSEKHKEGRQEYSINIIKDISRHISICASHMYILNDANISAYNYSRNISGLFVMVRL